jgi:hypothetical protein
MEDVAYAQRIARLRNLYVALAPELEPYLVVSRERPPESLVSGGLFAPGDWQVTRTTAGMVAVVNSVVIGVSAGLALAALPGVSLAVPLVTGAAVGATALWLHCNNQRRAGSAYELEGIDRYATLAAEA